MPHTLALLPPHQAHPIKPSTHPLHNPAPPFHPEKAATLSDKRIVVAIDAWDTDSLYPTGHYVRTLGAIGDKETETEVLLLENDINTAPFTPAVHACVPPLPWALGEAEAADPARADLRHLPVCSVDPPGCKDIDDALHVRRLAGGNLELGVHIADVTHFLKPDTAMDEEAGRRWGGGSGGVDWRGWRGGEGGK